VKTVMVCWDAGREATRALSDAMPFIAEAGRVVIVTADAKARFEGHGEMPGADIALHLARHGVNVEVRNADTLSRRTAQALLDEARAVDADLIVMGGYGHSRMTQFMFGGVTREMLSESPIPLLMSH
jgi:nucleotide-binding universal stress UspA family protein